MHEVIAEALNGHAKELAKEMEVSLPRCYEILSKDCPYPKAKLLIRKIGRINKQGIWVIKADMDALFDDLLGEAPRVTVADVNKEAFEYVQAAIEDKPKATQKKELRDLIAKASQMLQRLNQPDFVPADVVANFKARRNGTK